MRLDHVIVRGVLTRRWQQATATSQFALEEDLALSDYDGEGRGVGVVCRSPLAFTCQFACAVISGIAMYATHTVVAALVNGTTVSFDWA